MTGPGGGGGTQKKSARATVPGNSLANGSWRNHEAVRATVTAPAQRLASRAKVDTARCGRGDRDRESASRARGRSPGLDAAIAPPAKGLQQGLGALGRDRLEAQLPHRLDRLAKLLDVLDAVRALLEMGLEAPAIVLGERALEVLRDGLDQLDARHLIGCAHQPLRFATGIPPEDK